MTVVISGLTRAFPGHRGRPPVQALDGLDLEVRTGELLVIVGPSGSGKTTLLRAIAGLDPVDAGTIAIDGRDVTALRAGERDVAMVFQDGALYPHLDVLANITFGLRARAMPRDEAVARARDAAALLSLDSMLARRPAELSGGERQRVALARAIVREPVLFLLDEPLTSLDAELRARAREEIRSLQRRLGVAMISVTHDHLEAMSLGQRVAVMRSGHVVQVDTPTAVYDRPTSPFVARLFGSPAMNVVPAGLLGLHAGAGPQLVGIRPERVSLLPAGTPSRARGQVTLVETLGADVVVHVRVGEHPVLVRADRAAVVAVGDDVGLAFEDGAVHRFPRDD